MPLSNLLVSCWRNVVVKLGDPAEGDDERIIPDWQREEDMFLLGISSAREAAQGFRAAALWAYPDKGGSKEAFHQVQAAKNRLHAEDSEESQRKAFLVGDAISFGKEKKARKPKKAKKASQGSADDRKTAHELLNNEADPDHKLRITVTEPVQSVLAVVKDGKGPEVIIKDANFAQMEAREL